jgi:phosphatidylinositol alpha-1,6-mannosyltransferase
MIAPLRSVLVTPNLRGADGLSCLSRQILHALPEPAIALSLHDAVSADDQIRSAGGNRARFVAHAMHLALRCDRQTTIVCSHVHLAPVAQLLTSRGAAAAHMMCGVETWVRLRPLERLALASGRLVAISRHTARQFVAANPSFGGTRIDICHPGLPVRDDTPIAAPTEPAALIVARMARNERYKGHDELLGIWPRIVARTPSARLWIVGDGDDRPRLEALAARLAVTQSVTFTGLVDDEELDRRYRRCRFFVMPSRHEGFGLAFLEAMRAGRACIGAPGAASEIIERGRTGLIVDPSSPDALAAAIVRLFDEPQTCDAFGRAGAARFHAEFTDRAFAARLGSVIRPPECSRARRAS